MMYSRVSCRWVREACIQPVLRGGAEMVAECGAVVVVVVDAALLQEGDDVVDEGVDAVFVDVDGDPEPVAGAGFEPFLQVVRGDGRFTDRGGVVVDDAVGDDVSDGPSFACDLQCPGERGSNGLGDAAAS